jgi:hypothetical protein
MGFDGAGAQCGCFGGCEWIIWIIVIIIIFSCCGCGF